MTEINFSLTLHDTSLFIDFIKFTFISVCTLYSLMFIINIKNIKRLKQILIFFELILISFLTVIMFKNLGTFNKILFLIMLLTIIAYFNIKKNIGFLIIVMLISFSINYCIFSIAIILNFFINILIGLKGDFLNLLVIMIIQILILSTILKIKKFKYGISYLKENMENNYTETLILNISVILLFSAIMIVNADISVAKGLVLEIIISSIIMFITIQKSLQLYYKQKLLIQDLNETKQELEKKKQEIEQLEKENLEFSKKSHSLAHKQRALEYQINQILLKYENSKTNSKRKKGKNRKEQEKIKKVKNEINKLSEEMYNKTVNVELTKTGIFEIDNILEYMKSECNKNNINFNLKIVGNIYHMTNKIIEKGDLQILLADHIKNAIIAIKHSDNINKSILVKLGKINDIYSLYIYDSGIEFQKETLLNLGKKPSTTHSEEGGTGMGFMNTFDTLKKYSASLIIKEIGKLSKENYTKILIIIFNNKCEFNLISYRQEQIGKISEKLLDKSTKSDIIVENKS